MKTIVLDTNILIDNVHGFAAWLNDLLDKPDSYTLIVPTVAAAEYLTANEAETEVGERQSKKYLGLFKIQDLTFEIAEQLGKILRRKTYPRGADFADLIIAATAIYLDAQVATNNREDFKKIPNLRFFDPTSLKG